MALHKAVNFIFLLLAVGLSQQGPIIIQKPETKLDSEDYRLANEVEPINYKIHLTLPEKFYDTPKEFTGIVEITLKVISAQDSAKEIVLNANSIKLPVKDQITLNKKDEILVNLLDITKIDDTTHSKLDRIVFPLQTGNKLTKDEEYVLRIPYVGKLHDDMYGFYVSTYKVKSGNTEVDEHLAATQFQPVYARRAFPCFDEPQYKSTFEIAITHPLGYQALSNAAINKRVTMGSMQTTIFEKTPKMSTYIVAFVVSKFKSLYEYNEHVQENKAWAQPALVDQSKYAHDVGPKIIQALNTYTGLEYSKFSAPIDKLDQIAIPDFSAGAMENWGLVTYRESALLYDENESELRQKQRVATIVAHELAHMWFGNLVTCKWWSSTWLNEGFARYFQYFATAEVEKDWEMDKQFVIEQQRSIFIGDASEHSQPLTMEENDVNTPGEIRSRFGSITYNKGGSIIRMMENFLGKDIFQAGIKKYLENYKGGNTVPDNLWDAFTPQGLPAQTTLKTIMDSWTMKAGYPVIDVELTQNKKSVKLTQTRFISHKVEQEIKGSWYIPITYTTSQQPNFENIVPKPNDWLIPDAVFSLTVDLEDESSWIILNLKDSAYYRVNYGDALWLRLKENALNAQTFGTIDILNRAQIVDDVLNLARAGKTTYDTALTVASYLEHETDYYPWYSAFNAFSYIRQRFDPEDEAAKLLKIYIRMQMKELYESVSFEEEVEESQVENYKKVLALTWACELGEKKCIEKSKELFNLFRTTNQQVQPDLRKVVYCSAVRDDRENWDVLRERLRETKLASEISTIISALGCSTDQEALNLFLADSVNPASDIRSQDAQSVYTSVISGSPIGVETAFNFLKLNFEDIENRYGGMNALSSVITTTGDRLTTENQIIEFTEFIEAIKEDFEEAATVGEDAIAQAEENVEWIKTYGPELLEYLKKAASTVAPSTTTSVPSTPSTPVPTTTEDPGDGSSSVTVCSTILILSVLRAVFRI